MLILLASVASAATAVSRIRIASISGNAHILLLPGEAHRSGEPFGHDLGDVGQMVQLREEPLHLLASHVAPELVHIFDVEGHDVLVGRSRVRAEQAAHPVIPPVVDRWEVLHGRRVGVEDPALVDLRVNAILEVDQYYHRRHRINSLARLHDDLVHVAPDPTGPRFEGLNQRVQGGVEVPGRVLVFGRIATHTEHSLPESPTRLQGTARLATTRRPRSSYIARYRAALSSSASRSLLFRQIPDSIRHERVEPDRIVGGALRRRGFVAPHHAPRLEAVATTAPAGDCGACYAGPRSRVEARVAEELRQALEEMGREMRREVP